MLVASACRHRQPAPAPAPPPERGGALVLRYCIAPPEDAGPAMSVDEAIQVIEKRIADHGGQVHAVDEEIVVEPAGPVLQPCP
jgi:hypothetical protein